MKERVQKIIASAGLASRRAAEKLILEGRVEIDGTVVKKLGTLADPEKSDIRVDGTRVKPRTRHRYVVLNKPRGYVTTRSDPSRRRTVMDLLPARYRSLYPVGRLDMATSGLLVLTDDGDLAQRLAHPRYGVSKTYLVTVAGVPDKKVLERAQRGIRVDGERLAVEDVRLLPTRGGGRVRGRDRGDRGERDRLESRLAVVLREGRNREIRRLFEALGHPVVSLHREGIGALSVRGLPVGAYRPLTRDEVERLRNAGER